jgi:hypothetical protein
VAVAQRVFGSDNHRCGNGVYVEDGKLRSTTTSVPPKFPVMLAATKAAKEREETLSVAADIVDVITRFVGCGQEGLRTVLSLGVIRRERVRNKLFNFARHQPPAISSRVEL